MEFSFTYSPAELAELSRLPRKEGTSATRAARKGAIGWAIFLMLVVAWIVTATRGRIQPTTQPTAAPANGFPVIVIPLAALIGWGIVFLARRWAAGHSRASDANPSLRQPRTLTFDDEGGVTVTSGNVSTCRSWPGFSRWGQSDNLVWLRADDDATVAIPKRAVPDERQMNALLVMLASHIDPPVRKPSVPMMRLAE